MISMELYSFNDVWPTGSVENAGTLCVYRYCVKKFPRGGSPYSTCSSECPQLQFENKLPGTGSIAKIVINW